MLISHSSARVLTAFFFLSQIVVCRSCLSVMCATTPALHTLVWGTIGGSITLKNLIGELLTSGQDSSRFSPQFIFFLDVWLDMVLYLVVSGSMEHRGDSHTHTQAHTFVIYLSIFSTVTGKKKLEVCGFWWVISVKYLKHLAVLWHGLNAFFSLTWSFGWFWIHSTHICCLYLLPSGC